jgi:glycyl-tRNA synthetase
MWKFALDLGLQESNLRWREHEEFERSHYSKKTMDVEYNYPFGFKEMFGLAYRTDFDLKNHAEHSGKDMSYFDDEKNERIVPHVVEPTFGLSRLVGVTLFDAYREEEKDGKSRVYLALDPKISPVKAAVFPLLSNKPELVNKAQEVYRMLKEKFGSIEWDDRGNIGKRYLSQDEIGTPFCITVDFDSLQDDTVTIRHRDTTEQERVKISELPDYIQEKLIY